MCIVSPVPSSEKTQKHEEQYEAVKGEDDINVKGGEPSAELNVTNECEMDKKRLWCYEHECAIRCSSVTSKKWQYSKTKMKYMWVTKYVKKYVCLSKCDRQVQQMVTDTAVGKQTTPVTIDLRENCETGNDDYSGTIDDRFSGSD